MNAMVDILSTPFSWATLAFTTWWGALIWLAVLASVVVAYRRQLVGRVSRLLDALRRRGS